MPEREALFSRFFTSLSGHCCLGCEKRSTALICSSCMALMPGKNTLRCVQCALPLASGTRCGACLKHPPFFDDSYAAWDFSAPASTLVKSFKFRQMPALAKGFARHMLGCLPEGFSVDFIIPVPLASSRIRQRGFNQAWVLSQELRRQWSLKRSFSKTEELIPLPAARWDLVSRVIDTPVQHSLDRAARQANLRGAFLVHDPKMIKNKHVLLVDDVMTTAATLNELARTVKNAGASRASCLVVCRTA